MEGSFMKSSYSNIMQSKYFNVAFNSAIFDGPIRIYFAQFHEAFALKIYFEIQQRYKEEVEFIKTKSKNAHSNILIMIYPTREQYEYCFASDSTMQLELWNEDVVIGIEKPNNEMDGEDFFALFEKSLLHWKELNAQAERFEAQIEI